MSKFGWDLPPGCRTSDLPGNDPEGFDLEELEEALSNAFHLAQRSGVEVESIMRIWREAASEAQFDMEEEQRLEAEAEAAYLEEQAEYYRQEEIRYYEEFNHPEQ